MYNIFYLLYNWPSQIEVNLIITSESAGSWLYDSQSDEAL